jgi:hypothetical protein
VGLSWTELPLGNVAVHTGGHEMPAGMLVTRPLPAIDMESLAGKGAKLALIDVSATMRTVQAAAPEHGADHRTNWERESGWALMTTGVF